MQQRSVLMAALGLAVGVMSAGFGCGSAAKPGATGAGGHDGGGGGLAGSGMSGAPGDGGSGTGAAGSGAAGTGAAGIGSAGTGATGTGAAGTGAAGTAAGPDPYAPLPAAEAPLARGTWIDHTPCRWSPSVPQLTALAHDATGRLFVLTSGKDSQDVDSNLFEWDHAGRFFWNRTACKPESTWPVLQYFDAFGYDPSTNTLVIAGQSPGKTGYLTTWRRAPAAGQWTRTTGTTYWPGFFHPGDFTRDEKRKSLILWSDYGLAELVDGTSTWKDQISGYEPTMFPPAQKNDLHIYDPSRGTVVRVVYDTDPAFAMQTWEYSLITHDWVNRTPAQSMKELSVVRGWWNPVSQRASILAFLNTDPPSLMQVWEWDAVAATWNLLVPAAGSTVPPATTATSSFDVTRGRLVVAAQAANGTLALWAWTVATKTWTRLSPEHWNAPWPSSLQGGAVYDFARRRTVVVSVDSTKTTEVLEWDGVAPKFDDLHVDGTSPWPNLREGMLVAYDGHRQRILVYGSEENRGMRLWEWDGNAKRWTDRSNPEMPDVEAPSVGRPSMAYDAKRRRLVLLGAGGPGRQIWEWDPVPGTWQSRAVPADVSARLGAYSTDVVAVYDESRGCTVFAASPSHIVEWDGNAWTVPTIADVQTAGLMVGTYDARRARTMLMTLDAPKVLLSWDGQRLVNETPASLAAAKIDGQQRDSALVYDRRRGNLVLLARELETIQQSFRREQLVWEGSTAP
jgi:hypothetical protein